MLTQTDATGHGVSELLMHDAVLDALEVEAPWVVSSGLRGALDHYGVQVH